jgi:hypothetical protein
MVTLFSLFDFLLMLDHKIAAMDLGRNKEERVLLVSPQKVYFLLSLTGHMPTVSHAKTRW